MVSWVKGFRGAEGELMEEQPGEHRPAFSEDSWRSWNLRCLPFPPCLGCWALYGVYNLWGCTLLSNSCFFCPQGSVLSERDYESLVMMRMRQAAERQQLIAQMQQEDEGRPT